MDSPISRARPGAAGRGVVRAWQLQQLLLAFAAVDRAGGGRGGGGGGRRRRRLGATATPSGELSGGFRRGPGVDRHADRHAGEALMQGLEETTV